MSSQISQYKEKTDLLKKDSLIDNTPHRQESMQILLSMQDAYQYRDFSR